MKFNLTVFVCFVFLFGVQSAPTPDGDEQSVQFVNDGQNAFIDVRSKRADGYSSVGGSVSNDQGAASGSRFFLPSRIGGLGSAQASALAQSSSLSPSLGLWGSPLLRPSIIPSGGYSSSNAIANALSSGYGSSSANAAANANSGSYLPSILSPSILPGIGWDSPLYRRFLGGSLSSANAAANAQSAGLGLGVPLGIGSPFGITPVSAPISPIWPSVVGPSKSYANADASVNAFGDVRAKALAYLYGRKFLGSLSNAAANANAYGSGLGGYGAANANAYANSATNTLSPYGVPSYIPSALPYW